jgi:aspartyl-tRNA(Asn)/glutamyl-tRNA(Gln) amidotransferase subunit A
VGLKTTLGRIPRGGGLPQLLLDMEVVGPLTRSVRDHALLFDVLAQPDVRDHRSLRFSGASSLHELFTAPRSLRILAVERFPDAPVDPNIRASFQQMVGLVKSMGHHVETGDLPLDIRAVYENWASIGSISLGLLLQREPQMRELASRKYVEWGDTSYDATHLLKIMELLFDLRNQAARAFEVHDIIMTPCCAAMPWSTAVPFPTEIDNQPVGPRGSAVYSGWVNACGHPAISVPGLMNEQSMPIGIQFVGNFGQDELLLRLAQQIENEQSWLDEWPPIAFGDHPIHS